MQRFGLVLLERQDNLDRGEALTQQWLQDAKMAMLAGGWADPANVFADTPQDVDLNQTETDYDYSGVEFQGSESFTDADQELLRLLEDGDINVSGEDF